MKKFNRSLFVISALFAVIQFCGCNFNLTESKYLDRPDVDIIGSTYQIRGSFISSKTESITIFRQNTKNANSEVERVAVIYPKGIEDKNDQTFVYTDERVMVDGEYRYYLIFTEENGTRNRTEWSEPKHINSGATSEDKLAYNTSGAYYVYDPSTMQITLNGTVTPPDNSVITDISNYKPALVFKTDNKTQTFTVPGDNIDLVDLKSVFPEDFLYTDVVLLGIVGQKVETNKQDPEIKKSLSWTKISPIQIKNSAGNKLDFIRLEIEHGNPGIDYSTDCDNEQ